MGSPVSSCPSVRLFWDGWIVVGPSANKHSDPATEKRKHSRRLISLEIHIFLFRVLYVGDSQGGTLSMGVASTCVNVSNKK